MLPLRMKKLLVSYIWFLTYWRELDNFIFITKQWNLKNKNSKFIVRSDKGKTVKYFVSFILSVIEILK